MSLQTEWKPEFPCRDTAIQTGQIDRRHAPRERRERQTVRHVCNRPMDSDHPRKQEIHEMDGGRDRDRTCDPFGVNEVLFR